MKFALEAFWSGQRTEADLQATARELRARHWQLQYSAGITHISSNDFSFYDHVLDTLVAVGATPKRFGAGPVSLSRLFAMARNSHEQTAMEMTAMEMTKWFDTNYHYLVPEWSSGLTFEADPSKAVGEFLEAKALGIETRPVLLGPCTLLLLGKPVADGFRSMVAAAQAARDLWYAAGRAQKRGRHKCADRRAVPRARPAGRCTC